MQITTFPYRKNGIPRYKKRPGFEENFKNFPICSELLAG